MKKLICFLVIISSLVSPCWGGVDFDGVDDVITTTSSPNLGTSDFSVYVVFSTTTTTQTFFFGSIADTGAEDEIIQIGISDGSLCTVGEAMMNLRGGDSAEVETLCTTNTFNDGAIYKSVWRYDTDGNATVYINGVSEGTLQVTVKSSGAKDFSSYPFYIGSRNNRGTADKFMNVNIYDVAFWSAHLTVPETLLLSNSDVKRIPLQRQPSNLLGHWAVDDCADGVSCDGQTFIDMSSNADDGTGDDGANNTGLTGAAEITSSY